MAYTSHSSRLCLPSDARPPLYSFLNQAHHLAKIAHPSLLYRQVIYTYKCTICAISGGIRVEAYWALRMLASRIDSLYHIASYRLAGLHSF